MSLKPSDRNEGEFSAFVCALTGFEARIWRQRVPPSRYSRDQILFYQGHYPYGVFVVHSGKVELQTDGPAVDTLKHGKGGILLGLGPLVLDRPNPSTAVATSDVVASFVEKTLVLDWVEQGDTIISAEINLLFRQRLKL